MHLLKYLSFTRLPSLKSTQNVRYISLLKDKAYVNGKWVTALDGNSFTVTNPADGSSVGTVPDMSKEDVKSAIDAASQAFRRWNKTTAKERGVILRKWHDGLMANQEDLAKLLTTEMGKPLAESLGEINYGASFLQWFAEEGRRCYGQVIPTPLNGRRVLTIKQAVGVATFITPWNFPNAMITRKAGAALAAGCTVVIKPAEETPYSALALCELAEQAGIPPGVFNVVTCSRENVDQVGKELTMSSDVAAFSFTGSTAVGKQLLAQCASTVKKVGMELGGNAPFIVFNSADIDKAVSGLINSKFRASGQTCVCANRILVQDKIHDEFVEKVAVAMTEQLRLGNGLETSVSQGPLINTAAVAKVENQVKDAISKGAQLVLGGKRSRLGECFFEPTLLTNVTSDMECASNETFGPMAPVFKFKTEEEALSIANDCRHGLAGYFFSNDINQVWRVAEQLEVGMVGINDGIISGCETPFGGYKESGLGREGSHNGLEEFVETKYLCFGGLE
ncbi:succinate-semialdehyde dehydrogenase, mitochondrial-like [Tubulanus polymorphus]|uniref:succinate-semialdehyde dehydrogenase, mitochondrial-like n=1 Tax=Tubulanus polymorphus TaxID=672921 RepID=UPI003DA6B795